MSWLKWNKGKFNTALQGVFYNFKIISFFIFNYFSNVSERRRGRKQWRQVIMCFVFKAINCMPLNLRMLEYNCLCKWWQNNHLQRYVLNLFYEFIHFCHIFFCLEGEYMVWIFRLICKEWVVILSALLTCKNCISKNEQQRERFNFKIKTWLTSWLRE